MALWLALDIRLHGHNFTISVEDSHFRASPNRLREFHAYFAYLTSDMDDAEEELSMEGGFDWAVRPFLAVFTRLAPEKQPVATISLDEYFNAPLYKCQLGAVDDEAATWAVTLETPQEERTRWIGQIQHTLRALHAQDIVWGDVRASHVLIDGLVQERSRM